MNAWKKLRRRFGWASAVEKKKQERIEVFRGFVIDVGRTHLACALVEQQLHDILRSFGYPEGEMPEWLARGDKKKLRDAVRAIRSRFEVEEEFASDLETFCDKRNAFVHEIWRDPVGHLEEGEGMRKVREKVLALYVEARIFNLKLGKFLIREHGTAGRWNTEWLEPQNVGIPIRSFARSTHGSWDDHQA